MACALATGDCASSCGPVESVAQVAASLLTMMMTRSLVAGDRRLLVERSIAAEVRTETQDLRAYEHPGGVAGHRHGQVPRKRMSPCRRQL